MQLGVLNMSKSSWSTVSLVKDTKENIRRFVSWHLAMGAAHMHLFFDDPNDPSIEMLQGEDRVTAVACGDTFWKKLLGKNVIKRHGRRQNSATSFGYRQVQDGWVVNLDCDEFLYGPDLNLADWLAQHPEAVNVIRLRPAEQVLPNGEGGAERFRLPTDVDTLNSVHGDFALAMRGRGGFFGHTDGKSIIRAGLTGISLRQHWPQSEDRVAMMDMDIQATPQFCLLHRNAEDYENWRRKLDFRVNSVSIPGPLREYLLDLLSKGDEEQLRTAHHRVFHMSPSSSQQLAEQSQLLSLPHPLDTHVAHIFHRSDP